MICHSGDICKIFCSRYCVSDLCRNPNGFLKYTHTNPSKLCVVCLIQFSFSLPVHIHPAAPHMQIERSFVLYISSDEKRNIENDINVFYIPFKYTNILFLRGHRNPLTICSPSGFFPFRAHLRSAITTSGMTNLSKGRVSPA